MIELPFSSEMINIRDLKSYIRSEFPIVQRVLPDSIIQNLANSIHQQLDKQSQILYLLRLVLTENYLSQHRKKFDSFDFNIDEILNAYIGKRCLSKIYPHWRVLL